MPGERHPKCRHCGLRFACKPGRLCGACHGDPAVRACYPRLRRGRRCSDAVGEDATAAEVEALVREQMACLPPWWWRDWARLNLWGGEGEPRD